MGHASPRDRAVHSSPWTVSRRGRGLPDPHGGAQVQRCSCALDDRNEERTGRRDRRHLKLLRAQGHPPGAERLLARFRLARHSALDDQGPQRASRGLRRGFRFEPGEQEPFSGWDLIAYYAGRDRSGPRAKTITIGFSGVSFHRRSRAAPRRANFRRPITSLTDRRNSGNTESAVRGITFDAQPPRPGDPAIGSNAGSSVIAAFSANPIAARRVLFR
jgi:hypothetical protein